MSSCNMLTPSDGGMSRSSEMMAWSIKLSGGTLLWRWRKAVSDLRAPACGVSEVRDLPDLFP